MQEQEHQNSQVHSKTVMGLGTTFDDLAKGLASGTLSRGKALRLLGGALVGATLASLPGVAWASTGGNSACAHYCNEVFPPGRERGRCKSQGTKGRGPCYSCTPGIGPGPHFTPQCGPNEEFDPEACECEAAGCTGEFYEGYNPECKANEFFNTTTCTCEPTICPEVMCCCNCFREREVIGCTTEFTTPEQCINYCRELGAGGAGLNCLPNEFNPNSQVFCGPDNTGCTGPIPC
jgi:hypothetical protein